MTTRNTLEITSPAYDAMLPYWKKIKAIRGGVETMRAAADTYLPKFPHETQKNYDYRVQVARFTDIFSDITDGLASRPFEKEVTVECKKSELTSAEFQKFAEDVDGGNNHLTVFAADLFESALLNAIEWVVVDYPKLPEGATLADARALNARPYWLRVQADGVLMALQSIVNGKQEVTYFKMKEAVTIEVGGQTRLVDQFRVFRKPYDDVSQTWGKPEFEIWRSNGLSGQQEAFELVDLGYFDIPVIPVVPLAIGQVEDDQFLIRPPMRNLADMQVEYFQEENNLKSIKTFTAFPMYVGVGMDAPVDKSGNTVEGAVGPSAIVYTGVVSKDEVSPDFKIIEPAGGSLQYLSSEKDALEKQMRELGRMPLVAGTAGITQVAATFASKKSSSALQEWAGRLKDALEKVFAITAMWKGYTVEQASPEVTVFTDFSIELSDKDAPRILLDSHKEGVISRSVLRDEFKRRGILSPNYDPEKDDEELLNEVPAGGQDEFEDENEGDVDDAPKSQDNA